MNRSPCLPAGLAAAVLFLATPAFAQMVAATVAVESYPDAIAVNPVTNKVYVANRDSGSVSVIDGATNETVEWSGRIAIATRVTVGTTPVAVAVNPHTNRIYVANRDSGSVTVIDGATRSTTTVAAGTQPAAIAVNPLTNTIFVANEGSASLTVIDGADNSTTTVAVGTAPRAVAVNFATNRIYVANHGSNDVTVVNGASLATATVAAGSGPRLLAVNMVLDRVYVLNGDGDFVITPDTMTVIDGESLAATTVPAAFRARSLTVNPVTNEILVVTNSGPTSPGQPGWLTFIDASDYSRVAVVVGQGCLDVAVDALTNRVYVSNGGLDAFAGSVSVIDGHTRSAVTVPTVSGPTRIAVNPVTHRAYVTSPGTGSVVVIDAGTNAASTIATGNLPQAIAVNPVTNRIYVANSSSVTMIDGATDTATPVALATLPGAIAVNPVTNRIYVTDTNPATATVTVIDGSSHAMTGVTAGPGQSAVAVNPATNRIYVASEISHSVTVIDGAANATSTVVTGAAPRAIAVNPVTNRIYVANSGGSSVTVIDGSTNATATIPAGAYPVSVAVDTAWNRIYVANRDSGNVTVIDGATDTVLETFAAGSAPSAVAVNPFTHRAYVANFGSASVSVKVWDANPALLDPAAVVTVPVGAGPVAIAVDPVSNKAYVASEVANSVTVIDGDTHATTTVTVGSAPRGIALNAATQRVFVSNSASNTVTAIREHGAQSGSPTVSIAGLPGGATTSASPSFAFATAGTPAARKVYYQLDTRQGPWLEATGAAPDFSGGTSALGLGTHVLYAYASSGEDATLFGGSRNQRVGPVAAYAFTVYSASCAYAIVPTGQSVPAASSVGSVAVAASPGCGWTAASNDDWIAVTGASGGSGDGSVTYSVESNLGNAPRVGTLGIAGRTFTVTQAGAGAAPRLVNIATRGRVQTGDNVLIAGFIIGGSAPKKVLVTARGPSLADAPFNVPGVLADPFLQLFSGQTQIDFNDDWGTRPGTSEIPAAMRPRHAKEAAMLVTLDPGPYTAIVTGVGGTTGVAIVEVFEVEQPDIALANIATRGRVETGDNVLIAGFVIYGDEPKKVLVTARGPSMAPPPFNVPGTLADPFLQLFSGQTQIDFNDDWQTRPDSGQIPVTQRPPDAKEAAILVTLAPGAYTAVVTGVGATSGIAIVEVFAQ